MGNTSSSRSRHSPNTRSNSRLSLPIPSNPNNTSAPGSAIPLLKGKSRDAEQERQVKGAQEELVRGIPEASVAPRAAEEPAPVEVKPEVIADVGERAVLERTKTPMPGELSPTTTTEEPSTQLETLPVPTPDFFQDRQSRTPTPVIPPSHLLESTQSEPEHDWKDEETVDEREDGVDAEGRRYSATIGDMQHMLERAERQELADAAKGGPSEDDTGGDGAVYPQTVGDERHFWAEHEVEREPEQVTDVGEKATSARVEKRKRGDETPVEEEGSRLAVRNRTEIEPEVDSSSEGSDSSSSRGEVEEEGSQSESGDSVEEQDIGDRHIGTDEDIPVPHGPFESIYYEPPSATDSSPSSSSEGLNRVFSPPHYDKDTASPAHHGPTIVKSHSRSRSPSPSPNPYAIPLPQTPQSRTPHTPVSAIHLPSMGHLPPFAYSGHRLLPSAIQEQPDAQDSEYAAEPQVHAHPIPFPLPQPITNTDVISVQAPIPPVRPVRPAHAREDTVYYPAEPEVHVDSVVEEMMTADPVPLLNESSLALTIDQDPYGDLAHTPIRPVRDSQADDVFHFFSGPTEQSQLPSPTSSGDYIEHDRSLPDPSSSPSYGELAERLQLSRSQVSVGRPGSPVPHFLDQHPSPPLAQDISRRESKQPSPIVVEPQQPPSPALSGRSPAPRPIFEPAPVWKTQERDRETDMGVLQAGVYLMSDERWDTSVDLHGGNHREAIAFGYHGGDNQQVRHILFARPHGRRPDRMTLNSSGSSSLLVPDSLSEV